MHHARACCSNIELHRACMAQCTITTTREKLLTNTTMPTTTIASNPYNPANASPKADCVQQNCKLQHAHQLQLCSYRCWCTSCILHTTSVVGPTGLATATSRLPKHSQECTNGQPCCPRIMTDMHALTRVQLHQRCACRTSPAGWADCS